MNARAMLLPTPLAIALSLAFAGSDSATTTRGAEACSRTGFDGRRQRLPYFSLSRRVSVFVSTRSSLLRRICASSESAAAASSSRSF